MKSFHEKYSCSKPNIRLLLIGPLPPPIGGATVLFELLIEEIIKMVGNLSVVNTSRANDHGIVNSVRVYLSVLFEVIRLIRKHSVVSFHTSVQGSLCFAPLLWVLCKIDKKPLVLRIFGGNFDTFYLSLPRFLRLLLKHTVLSCNRLLLESHQIVNFFENKMGVSNIQWYPNYRKIPLIQPSVVSRKIAVNKFVYIGAVCPEKGILQIIAAVTTLFNRHIYPMVDIYGKCSGGITPENFKGTPVNYRGILNNKDIIEALGTYDVLLLPTFYKGEGYPGSILEAFSVGIPVITTRWRAIPEIVENGVSGILVEPQNVDALASAIEQVMSDPFLYADLKKGAIQTGRKFSSETWAKTFLNICESLHSK